MTRYVQGAIQLGFDADEFRPIGLDGVFARDPVEDQSVAWEQAAQIVMLGVLLSGDQELIEVLRAEGRDLGLVEGLSAASLPAFDSIDGVAHFVAEVSALPYWGPFDPYPRARTAAEAIRTALRRPRFVRREWSDLLESHDSYRAVAFIAMHLWSRVPLLRACAAMVLARVDPEARFMRRRLSLLSKSNDAQISAMGHQGLSNLASPQLPALEPWAVLRPARLGAAPERSIAVHGTFAGFPEPTAWYNPQSAWSQHVRQAVPCDLWSRATPAPFSWEGRLWGKSRLKAAEELHRWTTSQGIERLRVAYAHSHGGNVALDYLGSGGGIDLLVLMHTPLIARPTDVWTRINANIGKALVLRTKLDLVVWADRLASPALLRKPQVALDHVIDNAHIPAMGLQHGWFTHSFFTKAETWRTHGVAQLVGAQLKLLES